MRTLLTLLTLSLAALAMPVPDAVFHGTVSRNGTVLTAADRSEVSAWAGGVAVARCRLGDLPTAGDNYLLTVPLFSADDPAGLHPGVTVSFRIDGEETGITAVCQAGAVLELPLTYAPTTALAPVFDPEPGTHPLGTTVWASLASATPEVTIYYTLDGSEPSPPAGGAVTEYTVPMALSTDTHIRARAYHASLPPSPVTDGLYLFRVPADADNDGLPDEWERLHFGGGLAETGVGDYDGDGESNLAEYEHGTDPADARATWDPDRAYSGFHFEIWRSADQTGVAPASFTAASWGARLACRPPAGAAFASGTLAKPVGSVGETPVALGIAAGGAEAQWEVQDYASEAALLSDLVPGVYAVDLVLIPSSGRDAPRHLRFRITVAAYTGADFPAFVSIQSPTPGATGVATTPLLQFDTPRWEHLSIASTAAPEDEYLAEQQGTLLATHQVPVAGALAPGATYRLAVGTYGGSTWLGAITRSTFTVARAEQTITFADLPSKTYGDAPFALVAAASSGLPVSFASDNAAVATVDGSTATLHGAGSCTITARQAGNVTWSPAPTVSRTLTVDLPVFTVTFDLNGMGERSGGGDLQQRVQYGHPAVAPTVHANAYWTFTGWSAAFASVTGPLTVTAQYREAGAVAPNGEFLAKTGAADVVAGRGLWDLTGSYTTTVAGNALVMNVVHDPTGKLTGTATYSVGAALITMPIKGGAKGSGGSIAMKGSLAGTDPARTAAVSLKLNLTVDAAHRQLTGRLTGSIKANGITTPVSEDLTLPIPAPMDGTWTLRFELDQAGRRVAGTALLTLSNGVNHAFVAQGRVSDANVVLSLAGDPSDPAAKPIRIRATVAPLEDGSARLNTFSAAGYGQRIGW